MAIMFACLRDITQFSVEFVPTMTTYAFSLVSLIAIPTPVTKLVPVTKVTFSELQTRIFKFMWAWNKTIFLDLNSVPKRKEKRFTQFD